MANTYTVLLSELVSEFNLDFFYKSTDFDKIRVTVDDISRPGLHLAGFFDHYEPMRVYVCGTVETAYLQKLSPEERIIIFDHFLSYKCPALIFARGFQPMPECLEMAKKYDVTVLGTKDTTSYIVSSLITYLKSALAPRVTRHGVLVEIYGEGILINGDSGIGKSETAIELVKRGHRLIADDAVEIKKVSPHELSAPRRLYSSIISSCAASASSTSRSCSAWARSRKAPTSTSSSTWSRGATAKPMTASAWRRSTPRSST